MMHLKQDLIAGFLMGTGLGFLVLSMYPVLLEASRSNNIHMLLTAGTLSLLLFGVGLGLVRLCERYVDEPIISVVISRTKNYIY